MSGRADGKGDKEKTFGENEKGDVWVEKGKGDERKEVDRNRKGR